MIKRLLLFLLASLLMAANSWIRVNQVGYTPESVKIAVLASKELKRVNQFELVEVLSGKVVFRSKKIETYGDYAAFSRLFRLDFSEFKDAGLFYVQAEGLRSSCFPINQQVYAGAADFLLNYMRQQRCGYNPFLADSCHTQDGFIVDLPARDSTHIDVTGGWHDASDYLQYSTTSANATMQMLFAYEQHPEVFGDACDANGDPGANGIPDILDEAVWGLRWLDKMNPEPGLMFNQIADDRDHTKFTLPTLDSVDYGRGRERPVYPVTGKPQGLGKYQNRSTGVSSTAAKFASAFALGSRLVRGSYPEFSQQLAAKAVDAYRYACQDLGVNQTACNRSPYFYEEDNYVDDMELAAVELYALSGDPVYLEAAAAWGRLEPVTPWMNSNTARHYQWYPFVNLGHYRVATEADSLTRIQFVNFLKTGIEAIQERGRQNGFQMGVPFIWCSNNLVAAALTQIGLYTELTGDHQFAVLEAALRDWLFGVNPWGTSMIIGYPENSDTPVDPHAAQTAVFGLELPGGLVDGPVYTSIFESLRGLRIVNGDEYAEFQSKLCVYHDDYGDYSTNEPTMDGTASLSYYLSGLETPGAPADQRSIRELGATIRGDTTRTEIHLVFTGHEFGEGGQHIRQVLKKHGAPAHFFFTGDFYRNRNFKRLIRDLKRDGHYLGAHSDKHLLYASWENRDSLLVSRDQFIRDLADNYRELARFGIDREKASLFLPPYEWYNEEIAKWTRDLGLTLINFSPGTGCNADYTTPDLGSRYRDSASIYDQILSYEASADQGLNGFILLLHIGAGPEREDKFFRQLDPLLTELESRGYAFTRLNAGDRR